MIGIDLVYGKEAISDRFVRCAMEAYRPVDPAVDTLGLVLTAVVHAANVQDRDGAKWVLAKATFDFARLRIVRADAGYAGRLVEWVRSACGWTLEIIRRTSPGFVVLPKRWVVERTFAWLGKYRRHSKDYEVLEESSEAFIYIAMIHIMVRQLD